MSRYEQERDSPAGQRILALEAEIKDLRRHLMDCQAAALHGLGAPRKPTGRYLMVVAACREVDRICETYFKDQDWGIS